VNISLREATIDDIPLLEQAAARISGRKEQGYFSRCLKERRVFIARTSAGIAGYAQLNVRPNYAGFRRTDTPEIQDLAVLPEFRNQGIGRRLVEHCEDIVRAHGGKEIGLSVGLTHSYGAAQRLYVKMGYLPDGAGIAYDDSPVCAGEMRPLDDSLTLKMVKNLD
jgi:ribosomal protein S18 acetylase RimI-like enzyme